MARTTRRFLFPAALVLFIMFVSAGRLSTPVDVKAAFDPNNPAWDPLSTFDTSETPAAVLQPPRLLAGTNSHALPANAVRRTGYCLDANIEGVTPVGTLAIPPGNLGFRLFATQPIDPADPAILEVPVPTTGEYVYGNYAPAPGDPVPAGVSMTGSATPSTADDVYCVVASAPAGYRNLNIEWHYQLGGAGDNVIALPVIPIVNVTLIKIGDGLVNAPAEVCTVGWDSGFLTGRDSNAGGLAGTEPDPVNDVEVLDFVTTGGSANVFVDYVRQVGTEWCAGIASTQDEDDIQVTFNFDAVYNRVDIPRTPPPPRDQDEDDQPASIQLPADRLVNIREVVELRHVTVDGQVPPRQRSSPLVINSIHYICVVGTDATEGDVLNANQIIFTPVSPPDAPGVANLQVFTKTPANDPRLEGVTDNTICFSYTSGTKGEQSIQVFFTNDDGPGGDPPAQESAFFDTDSDGNGLEGVSEGGPLITEWNQIDSTVITTGGLPTVAGNNVTFTRLNLGLQFNVADGTFIASGGLTEWVLGSHTTGGVAKINQLLDGAWLRVSLLGGCGYFVVPDSADPIFATPTILTGTSVGGRFELNAGDANPFSPFLGDTDADPDDIQFSTLNSPGCSSASVARIQVEVFYPGQTTTPAAPLEWVEFGFSFQAAMKTPRIAWAGQIITVTYALASDDSCEDQDIIFVRGPNQPGSFIPDPGVDVQAPDFAVVGFGEECSATVRYESEDSGEVDIEAFVEGNEFSTVAFPIFYLVFEDIEIEATPDQFVSSFGDATARLRGYFVGSNPSGRPQETKADGRTVPADRWVLPDDWEQLKGPSEFRQSWGSPTLPPAVVTFFMENESVVNNYKAKVKHGASGFFIPDDPRDFDFPFNINPHTRVPSVLGSVEMPRIMSQPSTGSGEASVDTFGDKNLSYEECLANRFNGNPQCEPEDIVGRTRYFAVVEYPQVGSRGKFPAIASNVAETVWRWAGYKDVTIVNTDSPQIKYVVARLRDRDGFCDAANFNNTLGVPVRFEIDAGGGVILEAADRPFTISNGRRFATATTFDTTDALGRPINLELARPPRFIENPDECQAWIKVTNSLMIPTNVLVTFPAPPSPVPGDIRITNLVCEGNETITVRNFGTNVVNLGGFSLESIGTDVGNAEQLDLIGVLNPGQSATFRGGPGADNDVGWIGTGTEVFTGPNDMAFLSWENFTLSDARCSGSIEHFTPPPAFPLDGEGEIIIDVTIPFGNEVEVPLVFGWNLIPTGAGTVTVEAAFADFVDKVTAVYVWDPVLGEWTHYIPDAPDGVNTIDTIGNGQFMWVLVKEPFTLVLPK